jgi:hypothetical protein
MPINTASIISKTNKPNIIRVSYSFAMDASNLSGQIWQKNAMIMIKNRQQLDAEIIGINVAVFSMNSNSSYVMNCNFMLFSGHPTKNNILAISVGNSVN